MAYGLPVEIRASAALTTAASPENGAVQSIPAYADELSIGLSLTAKGGTAPSLDVDVEWSHDGGTTWLPGDAADAFTQFADPTVPTGAVKVFTVKANLYRLVSVVAGASGTITFKATAYGTS